MVIQCLPPARMSAKAVSVGNMAKASTQYVCTECGWNGSKWYGRCPECGQWGTIEEFHEARTALGSRTGASSGRSFRNEARTKATAAGQDIAQPITHVDITNSARLSTGFSEFDRVLGGGAVAGSMVLIAGEPGIGKSTLLLQSAANIARKNPDKPTLYISGEESRSQVHMRAARTHALEDNLLLASTTDLATALGLIERERPSLAIVDSAQTIVSQDVDGIPGGSTQVREVAGSLIDLAKTLDVPVVLVGHITKDGAIAGPRTLEHLVDVVCQFEGDAQTALRLLHASKNRFGPTDEVGCFDMGGEGIAEVSDPTGLFISAGLAPVEGTCVTFTLEGHRSLPIEVQALVTASVLPAPRRATSGIDANRLAMLTAVLYRHGGVNLLSNDLYVSTIAGGMAREPSCDLAIVAALASAATGTPIDHTTCAIGEISLTGQVRSVPRMNHRLAEAARLGFTTAVVPVIAGSQRRVPTTGMRIIEVASLRDALDALHLKRR